MGVKIAAGYNITMKNVLESQIRTLLASQFAL